MQTEDTRKLADMRLNYSRSELLEANLPEDPCVLFKQWMDDAVKAGVSEPNAMTLATVSEDGQPSARIVLLKGLDDKGFSFFTNYESRKGRELGGNARAALVFFWKECERQVCVRGVTSKLSREESNEYFQIRPYGNQIGAWVSNQGTVIPGREWLEQRDKELRARFPEGAVPLPDFWGGYVLRPEAMEFWQGRPSRLHDRMLFSRKGDTWESCRLSP